MGSLAGNVSYYLNTGSAKRPQFTLQSGNHPFAHMNASNALSAPACWDVDADGRIDVRLPPRQLSTFGSPQL